MHVFHELPVAAWMTSPEGLLLDLNEEACALLGQSRDALRGTSAFELLHPDDRREAASCLPCRAGRGGRFRCRLVGSGHRVLPVELRVRLLADGRALVVVEDLGHLAEAEDQLVQREREFRAIFEYAASGKVLLDATGRCLRVNKAFVDLSGHTREHLLSQGGLCDLLHRDDGTRAGRLLTRMMQGDIDDFRLEARLLRPDGTERWVFLAAAALHDASDELRHAAVTVTDLTERRRAEEELRDNEALLRLAQRAAQAGVWVFDTTTGRATLSPEARVLHGTRGIPDPTVQDWLAAVLPEDRERVRQGLRAALHDGLEFDEEFRVLGSDGRVRWLWNLGRAEAPERPARKVRGIALDITERKAADRRLRQSEETWRTIAAAVPDALWIGDAEGRPELTNPRWRAYTGLDLARGEVPSWMTPGHPEDLREVMGLWLEARTRRSAFECELRYRRHDGEWRWFLARAVPVTSGGEVLRWVGTLTDIDHRRRAEDALREAARRKDEFMAILSHELRNPLAPIRTGLHVLQQVSLDSDQARRILGILDRQTRHLTRLVDDLLDVTRITRGKIALRKRPADLVELLRTATDDLRDLFAEHELQLELVLPTEPAPGAYDEVRIAQVLGNLAHNAVKFTPAGGRVRISLERRDDMAVLTVSDTGVGIPPELLPVLFEPFSQADTSLDRSKGGLGLGLALVRGLVQLHGGEVRAYSEGRGTDVVVTLPLA